MEDKFLGCIYGLAIGDALGYPNEFIKLDQILQKNQGRGTLDFEWSTHPPGSYTDDTQMSLAIANALLQSDIAHYSMDEIMSHVASEFVKWYKDKENCRAPGRTCLSSCACLAKGMHWRDSGDRSSKGCGTAMRTAPIGLVFHKDLNKLLEVAYSSSICTHYTDTAASAGIGTSYLVSLAVNNVNHNKWIETICSLKQVNDEFRNKIQQVKSVLDYKNHFEALQILGEGWLGHEAVALALYCVLKNPHDYEKTVLMGANTNGDSDSIACIAGAISGAYNGINKVPAKWVEEVEDSDLLRKTALALYQKTKTF